MKWGWVALAVLADVCVYFWHAIRWRVLLLPVVKFSFFDTARSIYVGLLVNEIIPLRAGELVRCYILSRNPALPLSVALSSALIERVFDGIWLCLCLVAVLHYMPLPPGFNYVVDGGYALATAVVLVAAALSFALFRGSTTKWPLGQVTPNESHWRRSLRVLLADLQIIGHSRSLLASFFQSLPYLLLQTLPIYFSMRGYGFDLSLSTAFALMVILRLGSVLPQAPGNIGIFQFVTREVLVKMFNVVPDEAARFSLVLWGIVTMPLLIGGLIALSTTGLQFRKLHSDAQSEAAGLSQSKS